MITEDKLLLAILKTVPKNNDELSFDYFIKELSLMGVSQESSQYGFLFDNELIEINETQFIPFGPAESPYQEISDAVGSSYTFKFKMTDPMKFIHLTDKGQVLLWSLESDHLREKFQELK